jgi:hypothetical protein
MGLTTGNFPPVEPAEFIETRVVRCSRQSRIALSSAGVSVEAIAAT